jgi:hypothetical protein
MPHYRTRVLTARERELVDRLARYPRYDALVERLTGAPAAPPKRGPGRPPKAKADEPETVLEVAHEPPAKPAKPSER